MTDPFAQYVVPEQPIEKKTSKSDPFAAYEVKEDPFAQYTTPPSGSVVQEVPKYLPRTELDKIAQSHGVDPQELKQLAPYYGVSLEPEQGAKPSELLGEAAKYTAGSAGRAALGIPQFLYKKTQSGPMREALDELREVGRSQQGLGEQIGESIVGGAAAAPESVAGRLAQATGVGGAIGLAESKEGEEASSAAKGAGFGLGAGLVGEAIGGVLNKLAKNNKTEQELVQENIQKRAPELEKGAEDVLATRKDSNDQIFEYALGKDLDEEAASKVVREQLDPESLARFADADTEEGQLLREQISKRVGESSEKATELQLANDIADKKVRDFAEWVTKERPGDIEEARTALQNYAERQGGREQLLERWNTFSKEEAGLDYIRKNAIRGGRENDAANKALNFISDAQFVLRTIDHDFGTALEPVHRELNAGLNRMSFARKEAQKELNNIFQKNRAVDAELTQGGKVYDALNTGNTSGLSSEEIKAYDHFNKYFKDWLGYVNKLVKERDPSIKPLSIPKVENYVPQMMLPPQELADKFQNRVSDVLRTATTRYGRNVQDIAELSQRELKDLEHVSPAFQELVDGIKTLNKDLPLRNGAEISSAWKDLMASREGKLRLSTIAKAALERQGEIPEWMREKNLYKLADKWTSNTLRHLYLRNPMDKMESIARQLKRAGGDLESNYLEKLLQDINGIRKGTVAAYTASKKQEYLKALQSLTRDKYGKDSGIVATLGKALPDVLQDMNRQIYPNLLFSARALIQNSTQLFTKTAPELGNAYGNAAILRGAIHTLLNRKQQLARVERLGFQPAEFVSKYRQAVSDGIRRSSLYSLPSEALSKAGEYSMKLYTWLDAMNRSIALSTADIMAHDLGRGNKFAQKALSKMPSTVRKQVALAQSPEEIANIIGSHLNASTQYNYNRASMSEYGRTLGPLFSVFSKWPTATAGEIIHELRVGGKLKGSARVAEKFLAPLVMLQIADYLVFGENLNPFGEDAKEKSERAKMLFSKAGLSQTAPIGSLKGIVTGDFFTPPLIDAVVKSTVVPILTGNQAELKAGLVSSIQNYMPLSGYIRFLSDDLPTIITNERPEGSNFIERAEAGVKKVTK